MNVCVYCSSSHQVDRRFFDVAEELGRLIGERKNNLVYGGGNTGPMNALAESVKASGGRVISVIPGFMVKQDLAFARADETVQTDDMQMRRMTMIKGSDVFVALPGGFGTMEEALENLTMRQLKLHDKPLVFLDVDGFWAPLMATFDAMEAGGFLHSGARSLILTAPTPAEALDKLDRVAAAG